MVKFKVKQVGDKFSVWEKTEGGFFGVWIQKSQILSSKKDAEDFILARAEPKRRTFDYNEEGVEVTDYSW